MDVQPFHQRLGAVVARAHGDAELVEGVEQTAYVVVDGGAATQIVADEFLIGCLAGRHPAHACRIEG